VWQVASELKKEGGLLRVKMWRSSGARSEDAEAARFVWIVIDLRRRESLRLPGEGLQSIPRPIDNDELRTFATSAVRASFTLAEAVAQNPQLFLAIYGAES
jgi:hypothetical protein